MKTAFMIYDGVVALDLFGAFDALSLADALLQQQGKPAHFNPYLCACEDAPVHTASGPRILPDLIWDDERVTDALVIPGFFSDDLHQPARAQVSAAISNVPSTTQIVTICTGAVIAAEAQLLSGHRVTTHWAWMHALRHHYPALHVVDDALYIRDGRVWSSAGVSAGMDLTIAWIREALGAAIALQVAKHLVLFAHRSGTQSQFSTILAAQTPTTDALEAAQRHIIEHLSSDLHIEALARHVGMSPRHFARKFRQEVGVPPGQFVQLARIQAAKTLLETSTLNIEQIADHVGVRSGEHLRQLFQRHLHIAPSLYRTRFQMKTSP